MSDDGSEAGARKVVEQMVAAINAGDRERLRDCLSPRADAVHIGTDPAEWWSGSQVVESLGVSSEAGVKVVVDDVTTSALADGVVVAVGRGHFEGIDGPVRPLRVSAVLTRNEDRWTVVHSHASFGVLNADVFS